MKNRFWGHLKVGLMLGWRFTRGIAQFLSGVISTGLIFMRVVGSGLLLLNLTLLVIVGIGQEAGFGKLPSNFIAESTLVFNKTNYAITFLVITLLTFAGVLSNRAQSTNIDQTARRHAQLASDHFALAGFGTMIALGLIFTAQLITPASLIGIQGWYYDLLRWAAPTNPALGFCLVFAAAWDVACSFFHVHISYHAKSFINAFNRINDEGA
jgi:hypothetical protein